MVTSRQDISNTRIKELFAQGKTQGNIAWELGCCQSLISFRLGKMGLVKLKKRFSYPTKKHIPTAARMCSNCKRCPVPDKPIGGVKLTMLCYACWRAAETEQRMMGV